LDSSEQSASEKWSVGLCSKRFGGLDGYNSTMNIAWKQLPARRHGLPERGLSIGIRRLQPLENRSLLRGTNFHAEIWKDVLGLGT